MRSVPRYISDFRRFNAMAGGSEQKAKLRDIYPILTDWSDASARVDRHYMYQYLWAARRVFGMRPDRHVDVGSRLDGFVTHVLSFCPLVTQLDIRPAPVALSGLDYLRVDATSLEGVASDSIASLSSLHVAEHFGLGRYGDVLSSDAHLRFMASLARVLSPGGRLYFSVPTGAERVAFNAHRVLAYGTVMSAMVGLDLVSFSAVTDSGEYVEDCDPRITTDWSFGCGLYEFGKRLMVK
ncbi:MAG: DUF268 domain-containing protein [Acidimicrobiales bacterium]